MSELSLNQVFDARADIIEEKYPALPVYIAENIADKITLRPYQEEAVRRFIYYLNDYIDFVRQFFEWLVANQKDYSKIKLLDVEFLSVSRNDKNRAKATGYQESHDVADILATIRKMPAVSEIEMRNKAIMSLFFAFHSHNEKCTHPS